MKLPQSVIDQDAYYTAINSLLNDKDCYLVIDTNILASFYRLHEKARNELFDYLDPFIKLNRLKTPAWALNEYTKKFIRNQAGDYLSAKKKLDIISNDFEEAKKFLSLHIDLANLPPGIYKDAAEYTADLKDIAAKVSRLRMLVKTSDASYINAINQQLKDKFDGTALESDIFALAEKVSISGPNRFHNQLPPGYEDNTKGFNAYGDLIIWEEIIGFARDKGEKKVILLTNDMKRDWMYAPQKVIVKGHERPNQEFKVVDPRLVYQFKLNAGNEDFHIINLERLTHILIDSGNTGVYELAAALQIKHAEEQKEVKKKKAEAISAGLEIAEAVEGILAEADVLEKPQPEEPAVTEQPVETGAAVFENQGTTEVKPEKRPAVEACEPAETEKGSYAPEALADKNYLEYEDASIGEIIGKLKSYNWYVQSPAIEHLEALFRSAPNQLVFSKNDLFVLGRNIYQTASGGAYLAMQFLEENRISAFSNHYVRLHLVSGMIYEVFFDSSGQLRRPDFKSSFIDQVFALLKDPIYTPAVEFIQAALAKYEHTLIVLPSKNPQAITFEISLKTEIFENGEVQVLEGVSYENEQLFVLNNGMVRFVFKQYLSEKDIKEEIKRAFAIPSWQQTLKFNPPLADQLLLARSNRILWRGPLPKGSENEPTGSEF